MPKGKDYKKGTRKRTSKPFGFIKEGKTYKLVFGTKSKPRIGKKRFMSKKTLNAEVRKLLTKKKK